MTTVISHFYNEEYLLPRWLEHHKKIFDNGIMIDYHSTDRSVEIIRDICPDWRVITTGNEWFDAHSLDVEVEQIESTLSDTRISVNITEFLVGDTSLIREYDKNIQFLIPSISAIDTEYGKFDESLDLLSQITHGITYQNDFSIRRARSVHNFQISYPVGRHFENYTIDKMFMIWVGYFPMNDATMKRKLQIQNKISDHDKAIGLGFQHHNWGKGLTEEDVLRSWKDYLSRSEDITEIIKRVT